MCSSEEKQFEQPKFTNDYVIRLLFLEIYIENIVEKGIISTIFCNLILDFCVKTRTRFSLRDKRLFEITEVEITRVDLVHDLDLKVTQGNWGGTV